MVVVLTDVAVLLKVAVIVIFVALEVVVGAVLTAVKVVAAVAEPVLLRKSNATQKV